MAEATTTAGAESRPPYMLKRAIAKLKEEIPVGALANDYGAELKPSGEDLRGKGVCHGGDNETALLVEPDAGRYYCFRCNEGGDVIDLARAVEGGELQDAVISLAMRYGVELPRRSDRWHEAQDDKARIREAAVKHVAARYQERLTAIYAPLVLLGGETPEEEMRELEGLARSLWPICWHMARRGVYGDE